MATNPGSIRPIAQTSICLPIGNIDSEEMAKMMDRQEELTKGDGGIVHTEMDADDHPHKLQIEFELIEAGYEGEDVTVTAMVSHTVGNTLKGMPELIVSNACPDTADLLIEDVEEAMFSKDGVQIDIPILLDGRLIQIVSTDFEMLQRFTGAYASFAAQQILMAQRGLSPKWLQIVYADEYHRFPWEPGADNNLYQPVAAHPGRYQGRGRGLA